MEGFCGALKYGLAHHTRLATRKQAQEAIAEYIEIFTTVCTSRSSLDIYLHPLIYENAMLV